MESRFGTEYTSSLAAIPVNRSALPASEKDTKTPDTFGHILKNKSAQLDLFSVSSKMSVGTLQSDLRTFTEAYEIWVTQLRQDYLVRQNVEHPIDENDSLSWATPNSLDMLPQRSPEALQRQFQTTRKGRTQPANLREQVLPENWPTPNLPEWGKELSKKHRPKSGGIDLQSAVWPTPQASEYKGQSQRGQHRPDDRLTNKVLSGLPALDNPNTNGKNRGLWPSPQSKDCKGAYGSPESLQKALDKHKAKGVNKQIPLSDKVMLTVRGKLNPDWVEQLMSLPVGWTDLGSWATG